MEVRGHRIEVPVMKDGRMVGKANAMLNLDRTMQSVLSLARRDQGEIPFARRPAGTCLYTGWARSIDTRFARRQGRRGPRDERHSVARR